MTRDKKRAKALTMVNVIGNDKSSNRFNTVENNSTFFRQVTYYGTLNYNRTFGEHDISVTGIVSGEEVSFPNEIQKDVVFHTGFSANYMLKNKYYYYHSI